MLQITIPGAEFFDENTETFVETEGKVIQLEHSLLSISKWEAKWKKPFLSREEKTVEEQMDYIRCMTVTPGVKPEVYAALTKENLEAIRDYIQDPMTATTFNERTKGKPNRHIVTSEELYYQIAANQIPFEVQKWHLNRLLTLLRIFGVKNQPPKKMSKKAWANQQRSLNAARRAKFNSLG